MPDRPRHEPPVRADGDNLWRYQSCYCGRLHGYTSRLPAPRMWPCNRSASCHPPERVQLQRSKGWRLPPWAVSVARPTRWGNPYVVGSSVLLQAEVGGHYAGCYTSTRCWAELEVPGGLTAGQAVALYRASLTDNLADPDPIFDELRQALANLAGWDLACWCSISAPCHAAVLLDLANR